MRHHSVEALLLLCSKKYGIPDITKMNFCTGDRGANPTRSPVYMSCHNKKTHPHWERFCGPGHTFYKWSILPETFKVITDKIILESEKTPKIEKVGWYGNLNTTTLAEEGHLRRKLKEISDKNSKYFEIVQVSKKNYKTMPEQVRDYKYLIDIGGNGYSGRLKYLLFSKRPLILVDRLYVEYFNSKLIPFVHYIPVKMDLSDLLEKEKWLRNNELKAKEIAQNAYNFAIENFSMDKILDRVYEVYCNLK